MTLGVCVCVEYIPPEIVRWHWLHYWPALWRLPFGQPVRLCAEQCFLSRIHGTTTGIRVKLCPTCPVCVWLLVTIVCMPRLVCPSESLHTNHTYVSPGVPALAFPCLHCQQCVTSDALMIPCWDTAINKTTGGFEAMSLYGSPWTQSRPKPVRWPCDSRFCYFQQALLCNSDHLSHVLFTVPRKSNRHVYWGTRQIHKETDKAVWNTMQLKI